MFLKPFGPKELRMGAVLGGETSQSVVRRLQGHPRGESYGLGYGWLRFDLDKICGKGSPCTMVSAAAA